jgi:hypothetical protein
MGNKGREGSGEEEREARKEMDGGRKVGKGKEGLRRGLRTGPRDG